MVNMSHLFELIFKPHSKSIVSNSFEAINRRIHSDIVYELHGITIEASEVVLLVHAMLFMVIILEALLLILDSQ